MNKQQEALKLALEFIEKMATHHWTANDVATVCTAIREALAEQPAQQQETAGLEERLAILIWDYQELERAFEKLTGGKWIRKSNTPASKPLTDEQIQYAFRTNSVMVDNGNAYMVAGKRAVNIARAIEAAHGIKGDA